MNDVFGKKLGQYILLEQLGEGGMAKVYNALDTRVDSNVAIKVILPSKRSSEIFIQQFEQEAKALANLTHTNIVKVLNYGVQDDQPYLVMEYISGGTLKEAMGQKLPWQTAAAVLAPIARALDYVHQQQIVHRDVKPANILLQEDFSPMLSDFGILKLLEEKEEKGDSAIGSGVGTPEYMPPEQGMGKNVDFRADIYSLGIVFYEMVTGHKAFTADTPMAIVIKHITDEIRLPSAIDRNIPKFVERAILRAVQKNPEDRYLSMGHFADVLELISLGDKTTTKEVTRISMQKAPSKRKPFPVAFVSALVLILTSVSYFTISYFQSTQTTETPVLAPVNMTEEIVTPSPTIEIKPTSLPQSTSIPTMVPELQPKLSLLGTPFAAKQSSKFEEIARWGIGGVNATIWSPDGSEIALGTTSGIFIYDATSRKLNLFIDTKFDVVAMAYNPESGTNEITAGSLDGTVVTVNGKTGEVLQTYKYKLPESKRIEIPPHGAVTAISYSPKGKYFAVGYQNGVINYYESLSSSTLYTFDEPPFINGLVLDGRYMYVSTGKNSISIWNLQSQTKDENLSLKAPPQTRITKLSLSNQGGQFLLGENDIGGVVYVWNTGDSRLIKSFTITDGKATNFAFSGDDTYIAIGLDNGTIQIFEAPMVNSSAAENAKASQPIAVTTTMGGEIRSISFSPHEHIMAAGNWGGGAVLWNAEDGKNIASLAKGMGGINELYISNDGSWLTTSHTDGIVRIWDVNSAAEYHTFEGYLPRGAPFSPNNQLLATIHSPGKNQPDAIQIVELKSGNIVAELPNIPKNSFVQFTNDNKLLITGTEDSARVWDVSTWEQLISLGGFDKVCGTYRIPPPHPPQDNLLAVISNAGILFSDEPKILSMCGFGSKIPGATLMYYFPKQNQLLFVLGDGAIWIGNNESENFASKGKNGSYSLPRQIFLAGEQESGWYAYKNISNGRLQIENLSGSSGTSINGQDDYEYRVAFLPRKNFIVLGSKYGSIHFLIIP